MAYGTRWNWSNPLESVAEAYRRAQAFNSGDPPDVLWRFEATSYASMPFDYDDDWGSTGPILELDCYRVHHFTPCGARLESGQFVNFQARKQFACRTPALALASYKARKAKAVRIHQARARRAGIEHDLAFNQERLLLLDN